ncbi:YdaU family protein [Serratia proteamaculans]|uniref:DUF1376 domain-containing protein n=1 Tax=Serratia proteamaculans TaxID=28151 RepID=A0A5Q2VKY1_SERPR|nr:DUF1376 domain-containing protein [Serratia proteamaculans]QGH64181.1 DUF1376 domain-containing protein [Serratia proteamaculans]
MAALPYMQFYVADYLADTMHLSTEEHGAYLLLIFNYWQTGKPLPKNRLAGIARLSNDRWTDVERSLNEFFIDDGNVWVHQRIERDLLSVKGAQSQRSEAGKKSAEKRLAKKMQENHKQFNDRSTGVERDVNDRSTNIDTDKDKELKDKHLLSGAEKKQLQTGDPVFITLPLNDETEFPVTESMLVEYGGLYPSVDVRQELRNQRGWLLSETSRRKTKRGIKRFITGWLAREQDRGPKTKAATGENHAEFRPNQNDQRSYYEQFTEWEQQQPRAASLGAMGADVQDVRPALECEEWQSTLGSLGGAGQLDDE